MSMERAIFADGIVNRGRHLSYQRSRHVTHSGTSLIKIEGVDDTNAAKYVAIMSESCIYHNFAF